MKVAIISFLFLLLAMPCFSADNSKVPEETVSYLSFNRLGSTWISPFTSSWDDKDVNIIWGAGTSYRLGNHLAITGNYHRSWGWQDKDISRFEAGLAFYFQEE